MQACGDAHLANFGGFAAPDRDLVFDINDFDETNPGPFEWDVKRLAGELRDRRPVAGALAEGSTVTRMTAARVVPGSDGSVRRAHEPRRVVLARLDANALLDHFRGELTGEEVKRFERNIAKAKGKDSVKALGKLARLVDGEYQIVSDPPVVVPLSDLLPAAEAEEFRPVAPGPIPRGPAQPPGRPTAPARELPGRRLRPQGGRCRECGHAPAGSRSLIGKDHGDPLFLQVKEAEPSVLEPHTARSGYANHGQRVVEGQRLLQAASDVLLGWVRAVGIDGVERDFYVRQMWDSKISADVETMPPKMLGLYSQMCGWTLARGHARSGDRVAIAAYLGSRDTFDRAIADFVSAYADQNQRD